MNDAERYERWLEAFKAMTSEQCAVYMQQLVQQSGPVPDVVARAFRDRLTGEKT